MSCDVPFGGRMARQSRPLSPSVKHHGGKSTEEKGYAQGGGGFFCRETMPEWYSNDLLRCTDGIDEVKSGSQPLQ